VGTGFAESNTKHRSSAFFGTFPAFDAELAPGRHAGDRRHVVDRLPEGDGAGRILLQFRVIIPEECIAQGSGPPSMHYISVLEMDKSRGDVMPLAQVIERLHKLA
jgi:hypothetical protein